MKKSDCIRLPGENRGPDVVPTKVGNQFKDWLPVSTGNPGFRLEFTPYLIRGRNDVKQHQTNFFTASGGWRGILIRDNVASAFNADELFCPPFRKGGLGI
jgi:hypothetical protein